MVRTPEESSNNLGSRGQGGSPPTLNVETGVKGGPSGREGDGAPSVGDAPVTNQDHVTNTAFQAFVDSVKGSMADLKSAFDTHEQKIDTELKAQSSIISSLQTSLTEQIAINTKLRNVVQTQSEDHAKALDDIKRLIAETTEASSKKAEEEWQKIAQTLKTNTEALQKIPTEIPIPEVTISASDFTSLQQDIKKLCSSLISETEGQALVRQFDVAALQKALLEKFTLVSAKFASKTNQTSTTFAQHASALDTSVTKLTNVAEQISENQAQRKKNKEERACKRAELKRKRSEDPEPDPQKGENEPEAKKQKQDPTSDPTSTSGQASEPPLQKDKGKEPETSEVPINPTPLYKLHGDVELPSNPKLAKFVLNVVSRHQETQPTKPTQPTPEPQTTPIPEPQPTSTPAPQTHTADPPTKPDPKDKGKGLAESISEQRERLRKFSKNTAIEVQQAHRYAPTDSKIYLMLPNFANDYQVSDAIKDKFMAHQLLKKDVYSKSPIKRITGVKHIQYLQSEIMYTIYEVEREDKETQYFCDNDLLSISPFDLLPLGKHMKIKMNEGIHPQDKVAFDRIIRCIRNFVKHKAQTDFQIGREMDTINLAISAPNIYREDMEKLTVGRVIATPELGMVYKRLSQKCFFRLSEAHKFSAEVIEVIRSFASFAKDDLSIPQEDRVLGRKIWLRLEGLEKTRKLTDIFRKIISSHPDAPF